MNLNSVETYTIATGDTHPVRADLYRPDGLAPDDALASLVVMCHGFKGHRRWGFIPHLAAELCAGGVAALSIDFSLNGRGESAGGEDPGFSSADAFRANTLRRERSDLETALAWVRSEDPGVRLRPDARVGLWGHSRGGVASLLVALDDPDIGAVSTWSTATHPDTYTSVQKKRWREKGALEFNDAATGTHLGIGIDYLDDLEANPGEYDLAARAGELTAPHLIVHGEHDLAVSVENAQRFYDTEIIRADKKLLRLHTGHTFGHEHADDPTGEALRRATEATVAWFAEYLAPQESNQGAS